MRLQRSSIRGAICENAALLEGRDSSILLVFNNPLYISNHVITQSVSWQVNLRDLEHLVCRRVTALRVHIKY